MATEYLSAVLEAAVARAAAGPFGEDGALAPEAQAEVRAILDQAEEEPPATDSLPTGRSHFEGGPPGPFGRGVLAGEWHRFSEDCGCEDCRHWRAYCTEGENKGKPGPCPKPKVAKSPKESRPTSDEAHAAIERVKANPTPEGVRELAGTLSKMTVAEVRDVKKRLGIRAGGVKAALVQKLAHEATRRITVRQQFERQARAAGVTTRDLHTTARALRETHNEVTADVARAVGEARSQYAQLSGGGRLHRGMKAFKGGDHTQIPGFDQITQSLMARYPDLLPGDEAEASEALFTFLAAGPPARMKYNDSYAGALDEIKAYGVPARAKARAKAPAVEEPLPWSEGGGRGR